MARRFGTDGIRGAANVELTIELAAALGRAAARVLPAEAFVVGRDTRRSGPMLQAALSAGLAAEGVDVVDLGVLPTPGVAWVAADRDLPGAVISASHNPFGDNGVKIFATGGRKLPDAVEDAIEAQLEEVLGGDERRPLEPTGHGVGTIRREPEAAAGYVAHLVGALEGRGLEGMRIVVDCAHGAASAIAPEVLGRLGAVVQVLCGSPDGSNINDRCGSTHPERLAAEVVEWRADLGLALDGDADRLLAVDPEGTVVGGDELLALFATDLRERGLLAGGTVVVTVMTNLGFHHAMAEAGINVRETPVGDRYVLEALDSEGFSLGGEQSGHVVFRRLATTGDGILTGVLLADLCRRSGQPLGILAKGAMRRVPQLLANVPVADAESVLHDRLVADAVARAEVVLGDRGRVLLRPSGTEPVVRVMVEADSEEGARSVLDGLCAAVDAATAPEAGTPEP